VATDGGIWVAAGDAVDTSLGWDKKHFSGNERDLRPRLDLIVEVIGDKPCNKVTREDVSRFKEVVMRLPSNRLKKQVYRDKSISELIATDIPENDLLSQRLNLHINLLQINVLYFYL